MNMRKIGSLEVTVVGLGCNNFGWRIDAAATAAVVDAALDAGINFFDTADIYGKGQSEEFLGRALGSRRSQIVLATKFGMNMDDQRHGAKPAYIRQAVEDSLRQLGTDHIDLYQLHRPDPETPIRETLGALGELVAAGKVREIGCSNFSLEQLREAESAVKSGAARFVSVQNQYSVLHREPESQVLPECGRAGLAFLPFFSARERAPYRQISALENPARRQPRRGGIRSESLYRRESRHRREAHRVRGITGPHSPGTRLPLAADAPGNSLGDRRREITRTGQGQRRGGFDRLAPDRHGTRGNRADRLASRMSVA